jgi:DnaJ family protein B protein 12
MEVNKDEAIRCLDISLKHLDAGNIPSARKFCLKSISLFETPKARTLLDQIDDMTASSSTKNNTEPKDPLKSQGEGGSTSGVRHRQVNGTAGGMGGEKREYTKDQAAVVKRVRSCKVTAYYEILAVKKGCDDSDIKKAYRKVVSLTPLEFNSR